MNPYEETKFIMRKYNIYAKKGLGQNFLINEEVINGIIEYSNITNEDLIIEIGPGLGTLTKPMLEKAKKVICIELDNQMIEILKDRFLIYKNLSIINEDILKVDLESIIKEEREQGAKTVKVIANLPYYITTPIIMKLLEEKLDIDEITVMVQKEVAERLIAIPGQRQTGAITYTVSYYTTSSKVIDVPRNSFTPEPNVDSQVINLKVRKEKSAKTDNEKELFNLIKIAFIQRRKTLVNALVNGGVIDSKQDLESILEELGINTKARAENLTLEQFTLLAKKLTKQLK